MKKVMQWLDDNLEMALCVIFMSVMTLVIFIQVIMRYVFQNSLSWSEEFARYCFIWLIYIGMSYGCRRMQHIKIDAALSLFPKKIRPYVIIIGDFFVLSFAVYILVTGMQLVHIQQVYDKVSPAMQIPMVIVALAPSAGFTLVMIRQIQVVWKRVRELPAERNGE